MISKSVLRRWAHQIDGKPIVETLMRISDQITDMTPEEFKDSLIKAGVIDRDGKLTEPYKRK